MTLALEAKVQGRPREALGLLVVAIAAHAALLVTWRQQGHDARPAPQPQWLELVRPAEVPPPPPVPPAPPPPPRHVQALTPPPTAPALRTPPADTEIAAKDITVPENTTAPVTAGPVVAAAPAPAAPPPAPKPEEPIVEANANAAYLKNPPPSYPALALRRGVQGTVLLRVHVQPDGRPDSVEVKQTSGFRMLDDAALDAVRHWSFAPAMRGMTALAGWATVPVEFKLAN